MSNLNEATARGAKSIILSNKIDECDIFVPSETDILSPMLEIIPLQLIAYYTALKKGCKIDKPRNLAKSVTVE